MPLPALVGALLPVLAEIGHTAAKALFPDPAQEQERAKAENEFAIATMRMAQVMEQAAAQIVGTEAASKHWLAANWRPLTMITFVALIVARWLGWTAPGISEAEMLKLWDIVQIGLGGYVVGRSAEKFIPVFAARKQP